MSKVRRKKIDCGPFGPFVLLDGSALDVISYIEKEEEVSCDSKNDGSEGFCIVSPRNEIYVWIGSSDYSSLVPHESLHAASSLLERIGVQPSLMCTDCEEILASLTGYVSDKICEQLVKWHP